MGYFQWKKHKENDWKYLLLRNASMITKALAQEKAGNTSKNLLNEIRQIIYSLYIDFICYIEQMKLLEKYITVQWIQ